MGKPTQPFAFPVEYLKEILRYNSRTGEFFWKITQGKAKKGFRAGYKRRSKTKEGYEGKWYWSIYIYDLESKNISNLTKNSSDDWNPRFYYDSSKIIFFRQINDFYSFR